MRLTLLLLCCLVQSVTWAGDLPKPVGKPILTISGNIENTNENGKAVFDLASLEKLGVVSFETTSPWYNGRTKFEGVPMSKLMDYVGAKGTNVNVIAL
ncbi:TPA: oxidoreductase, partial [Enterobacter roggenkampii]|nr:oxidoreductase [Enterobacter roggenkampii]